MKRLCFTLILFIALISCNNSNQSDSAENIPKDTILSDKQSNDTTSESSSLNTSTKSDKPFTETSNERIEKTETTSNVIEGTIDGNFEGFDGDKIFKLTNGQIWQQDEYKYNYSYKYRPKVTIINENGGYKMHVDGMSEAIRVKLLSGNIGTNSRDQHATADVIESYISSDFNGYKYENIYKLDNGQIWKQTDVYIYVYIYIRPKVIIYRSGGSYKMKFDNIDHAVTVQRID
jgi:hypothetical protein